MDPKTFVPPRMLTWAIVSLALVFFALLAHEASPGSVVAVSLYKAHLMALGGWGGYWLDRALFPYDRPHVHLEYRPPELIEDDPVPAPDGTVTATVGSVWTDPLSAAMLRRAIIVAACLVCVGLGA